ncbi:amino acid permease [Myxococcaceae bacterium GXIMD 01537]
MSERTAKLGVWPGVGLVAANMVGAGVFLSAGFMAQDMGPGTLLLAWVVGAAFALAGARAYSAVAVLVPRSGGEYRYLSDLLHPAVGYLAGWASLLVGFSAPVAADALAAGAFASTVFPVLNPQWTGAAFVVGLTLLHVIGMKTSARVQNVLIVIKALLLAGFVGLGLTLGQAAWPTWQPPTPSEGFPLAAFARSLFFVAFAFSGWNAAAYAAEEFDEPARTVPRAMIIGTILVGGLYLVVNWIFVANLTPEQATVVFRYETDRVTLGHAVMRALVGEGGAKLMSLATVLVFLSAMSAMTFAGPRVYAAMARDGFLPSVLAGEEGKPPVGSILLQGALSLAIVLTHSLRSILENVGAVLTLFAALTVVGLIRVYVSPGRFARPPVVSVVAAAIYALGTLAMFLFAFRDAGRGHLWIVGIVVIGLVAYFLSPGRRRVAQPVPAVRG